MIAGHLEILMTANMARLSSDMRQASAIVDTNTRQMNAAVDNLKRAFGALSLTTLILETIQATDKFTKLSAQLRIATGDVTAYSAALADVRRISTGSQADISATTLLYSRLTNALRQHGVSQQDVSRITESVSLGLKAYGATASEASSAMLQLSQAFGSGKLGGEELRAVSEAMPNMMQILADSMRVPKSEIRDLSMQSKITSEVMAKAWSDPRIIETLREQAKLTMTVSGSVVVLRNRFVELVGTLMQTTGASNGLIGSFNSISSGMSVLIDNIGALTSAVVVGGTAWLAFAAITQVQVVAGFIAARASTIALNKAHGEGLVMNAAVNAAEQARLATLLESNAVKIQSVASELMFSDAMVQVAATTATANAHIARRAVLQSELAAMEQFGVMTERQLAVATEQTAIAQAAATKTGVGLTTTLWGTSVAAQMTAGTLTKLGLALNVFGAVFVGWELGKMLNSFDSVRIVGLYAIGAVHKGFVTLQYVVDVLGVKLAGLFLPNYGDKAAIQIAKLTAQYNAQTKAIDDTVFAGAQAIKTESETEAAAKRAVEALRMKTEADKKAAAEALKRQQTADAYLLSLQRELEVIGLTTDAVARLTTARNIADKQLTPAEAARANALTNEILLRTELLKVYDDTMTADLRRADALVSDNKKMAENIAAIKLETESIGLSKAAIDLLQAARYDHTTAIMREQLAILDKTHADNAESVALREAIKLREQYKQAMLDQSVKHAAQAMIDLEKKATHEMWKTIEKTAHDTWMNIANNGISAFTNIGKTIKTAVYDLLYQMTVGQWFIGVTATVKGGSATAADMVGGGPSSSGAGSWLQMGKTAYDMMSNGFATLGSTISSGALEVGNAIYDMGARQIGASIANNSAMIGTIGSYIGAGMAGITAGTLIAGDKKFMGMSGSTTSTAGAVIGAIFGGPVGAAIGGAIGGVINAAFGSGPKVSGTTTLAGSFNQQGFGGQYQTPWSQSGGWFSSGSSGVDTKALPAAQQSAMTALVVGTASVFDALVTASGDAQKSLAGWSFAINRQVATQEQQNTLIADLANSMGGFMIPALQQFKLAGENLADTAVRMRDIFIVTNTIAKLVNGTFGATGLASMALRDNLVNLMGGLQKTNTTMQSYYTNFFTDSERLAIDTAAVAAQFTSLGLTMPASREQFRSLVESQNLSTTAGQKMFAALMNISGAFAAVTQTTQAAQAAQDAYSKSLQDAAIAAYRAARAGVDALRAFADSIVKFKDSLWVSAQSPLSQSNMLPLLRSMFMAAAIAAPTSATAQQDLPGAATAFLDAAKTQAVSAIDYARSFAMVQNELSNTAALTNTAVTVADQQLAQLVQANTWLAAIDTKNATQNTSLEYLLTAAIASSAAAKEAVDKQMAIAAANVAISAYNATNPAKIAADNMAAQWSAVTPAVMTGINAVNNPTSQAAQAAAIAAADALNALAASGQRISAKASALTALQTVIAAPTATSAAINTALQYYNSLPAFAQGTNYVPNDMVAQIHEGERIIPKADNAALMTSLTRNNDNSAVVAELRAVRSELASARNELRDIRITNDRMDRRTDKWDGVGMPEVREV